MAFTTTYTLMEYVNGRWVRIGRLGFDKREAAKSAYEKWLPHKDQFRIGHIHSEVKN